MFRKKSTRRASNCARTDNWKENFEAKDSRESRNKGIEVWWSKKKLAVDWLWRSKRKLTERQKLGNTEKIIKAKKIRVHRRRRIRDFGK